MTSSRRSRDRARERPGERRLLHPQRLVELFGRAGWAARLLTVVCAALVLAGGWLVAAPFDVDVDAADPPPFALAAGCPPALVAAVAGNAGVSSPAPEAAEQHERACTVEGRQRLLTGGLLVVAAVLNAAAALEWSRVTRRQRRRRRRQRRRDAGADDAARDREQPPS